MPRAGSTRKPHVTVLETSDDPRTCAGAPLSMEVTSDRSADLIFTEGLATRSRPPLEMPLVRKRSGKTEEATGVSEVRPNGSARKNNALHQSERPAEANRAS